MKGASFVPSAPDTFASDGFTQAVRAFQAAGGTYVNLVVPLYQSNIYATDIGAGYNTPTDAALAAGIDYAHSLGMHAQVSVYLESYDGQWRAYIDPSDRDGWYRAYGAELVHYGQLAGAHGVELYMLGAELIHMTAAQDHADNTERWNAMIAAVRGVYHGALTYGANRGFAAAGDWSAELGGIQFWDKLDYVGVSAYYELPGDGSMSSLESDWQAANDSDIKAIADRTGKPVLFTEVGYRSVTDAHDRPWDSWDGGSYDPQEQSNDYTALFDYWQNYGYVEGADLWWWSPDPHYGGAGNTDYTPAGKPAESVIRSWWSGSAPDPQPSPSPAPTPSPLPANAAIDTWWPTEGARVSGLQPFKAMIDGADASRYQMYWQVDNGQLVPMHDDATDWPHKEADVDLSGWTWRGAGPYKVNFVAKDQSGNVVAQKLVDIFIP